MNSRQSNSVPNVSNHISQKGTGNTANPGTVVGGLNQGPCGIAQIGGSGNQAAIDCAPARRLTARQMEDMETTESSICPTMPHIDVTAANANQEAQRYAMDFVKALKSRGCDADLSLPIPDLTPDVENIHIVVRNLSHIDANVQKLGSILNAAQIKFTINPAKPDFFPNSQFVLVVGAAPSQP